MTNFVICCAEFSRNENGLNNKYSKMSKNILFNNISAVSSLLFIKIFIIFIVFRIFEFEYFF
jgi:hypothetical protein